MMILVKRHNGIADCGFMKAAREERATVRPLSRHSRMNTGRLPINTAPDSMLWSNNTTG